jgi:aspartate ammonia-lyase
MKENSHTAVAATLYSISPYTVSPRLIRAVATVKEAAARCNGRLGYLGPVETEHLVLACKELRAKDDEAIARAFPIDAYQGGAGTSTNMAVNEWLASTASATAGEDGVTVDALDHANAHQSTNDVMPTALRLMMHDHLVELEHETEALQNALQSGEEEYEDVLKPARTQLREALVTTMGRQYATWSHAIGRDRWRCFKARERIREVNLGGTAIGTGAGAPRSYGSNPTLRR